jgi:hypothetical protein
MVGVGWVESIAIAIDKVVVIRDALRTGRDGTLYCVGSETLDVVETPLVRWIRSVVVAVCPAFTAYEGFVSQAPVIEDLMLGIMVAVGWLAHRLGELLGEGWFVKRWSIQPFLVAVADVEGAIPEEGFSQVSGEPIVGFVRPLALAHLEKELGGLGVGNECGI